MNEENKEWRNYVLELALCKLPVSLHVLGFVLNTKILKIPVFYHHKRYVRTPLSRYSHSGDKTQVVFIQVYQSQPANHISFSWSWCETSYRKIRKYSTLLPLRFYIILDWLGLFIYHHIWYSARLLYLSKNHLYCNEDTALYISLSLFFCAS